MVKAHRDLPQRLGRTLLVRCSVLSAIALVASVAQARTVDPHGILSAAGEPSKLVLRSASHGPESFADLAEQVQPAVIGVITKVTVARDKTSREQSPESGTPRRRAPEDDLATPDRSDRGKAEQTNEVTMVGSGFFISPDGYAVTNNHVVEGNDTTQVRTHDEKIYSAKVVGRDSVSDLALIKIEGRNDFSSVKLAEHTPRVGDWVLTVGNPFGLGGTVTAGIISARERNIATGSNEDFIQIDAPINSGDSGGPCFDADGNVIGVTSMIFSPSGGSVGVAFAIPVETVKTVIPQLRTNGSVTRGWMGIQAQSITPDIADSLGLNNVRGVVVASVQSNSPAAQAGLTSGDLITSIGGEPIKDARDLTKKIHRMAPGSSVQLGLLRKGKENSVSVTLGKLPD
jgi:serine protease Do